jgi:hypothetical protein
MSESHDPVGRHWTLMTKTYNGVVSILKELTEAEAKAAYTRLDPWYGRVRFKSRGDPSDHMVIVGSPSDIEMREVFGPPGWKMDASWHPWPRQATEDEEVAEDLRRTDEAKWRKEHQRQRKLPWWA